MSILNRLLHKSKTHIGIDIGTNSLKLAEFQGGSGDPMLKTMGSIPMLPGAYADGKIQDCNMVASLIRDLMHKNGIATKLCVAAVEGQHIFNRFIDFPIMSKEEALEAIKWDAERYLPYAPETCYMDAVVLPGGAGDKMMKVMLIAVKRELIDTLAITLKKADLIPIGIDFGPLALGRIMLNQGQRNACAILDLGAESSKLTFFRGQAIAFSRTLAFGGNKITTLLQEELGLDWQEAESFKIKQVTIRKNQEDADSLSTMITLALSDLTREIRRSLEYFQIQNRDDTIEQIYFTGGGSLMPGLREYLAADLGMNIGSVDLVDTFALSPSFDAAYVKRIAPAYMTAFGLALWEENQ